MLQLQHGFDGSGQNNVFSEFISCIYILIVTTLQ